MDAFHDKSVIAMDKGNYPEKFFWDSCESMVNNLHHGRYLIQWLPTLLSIIEDWKESDAHNVPSEIYDEAISMVKPTVDSLN